METMHEAVMVFIDSMLGAAGFNFSPETKGAISVMPDPTERVVKQWVRSSRREYGFNIVAVLPYSKDVDDLNIASAKTAQAIYDGVMLREKLHSYPGLPEGCDPERWVLPQNMPQLSGVNAEEGLARYQIQVKLIYKKQEV